MKDRFKNLIASAWLRDTRGGMAEYVILTVVVAVGAIAASRTFRQAITGNFNTTATTDLNNGTLKAP